MLGFRASGQEGILETSWAQKVGFIMHVDWTSGQKELHCDFILYTLYTFNLGGVRDTTSLQGVLETRFPEA